MITRLLKEYGNLKGRVEGRDYYSFPSVDTLAGDGVQDKLRELGFGYRCKYITESAKFLDSNHKDWLKVKRHDHDYKKVRQELMQLHGVGRKVADCICLFSLDFPGVVPVDTHVHQMAVRDYGLKIPLKSLTEKNYEKIQDCFINVFGEYAGWAHSILFAAELKDLSHDEYEGEELPDMDKLERSEIKLERSESLIKEEIKLEGSESLIKEEKIQPNASSTFIKDEKIAPKGG